MNIVFFLLKVVVYWRLYFSARATAAKSTKNSSLYKSLRVYKRPSPPKRVQVNFLPFLRRILFFMNWYIRHLEKNQTMCPMYLCGEIKCLIYTLMSSFITYMIIHSKIKAAEGILTPLLPLIFRKSSKNFTSKGRFMAFIPFLPHYILYFSTVLNYC